MDSDLYRLRHSFAHVLAQAIQKLYPGTLLGFGPPTEDGFYYDFLFPDDASISEADLKRIEKEMRAIIDQRQEFVREDLPAGEALRRIEEMGEPHKLEYARELIEQEGEQNLSFYINGPFVDMCAGPHVHDTGELPRDAFKLNSIAGAYWRGDERNVMLTRIYGLAYNDKKALTARRQQLEEARKRDHRKLGKELSIYSISDEVGKGLPLWLPNGAILRHELEKLAYEKEFAYGYLPVATPHITKENLYWTSGHLPLYEEVMYPPMRMYEDAESGGSAAETGQGKPEKYYLKPMNCPHHHMVYAAGNRSYRDLPLRLTEYGSVYRFERSGQLQGLTRVRGMCMNDAHLYVTPDQLVEEFQAVMRLHQEYYELFEFDDYFLRLSLWDPEDDKRGSKYFDDPEAWERTQKLAQKALDEMGLSYKLAPGEAAFYGPKVDIQFLSVGGREFTVSTNQIDFAVPGRFGLTYTDRDGSEKTPYCIHRAPLSTHERFIAFLIEHYAGAFPTWLAPVQVIVIPVGEEQEEYARGIRDQLRNLMVRAEVDDSDATLGKKVRTNVIRKIPILLVVGGREAESGTVTVRRHGIEQQDSMSVNAFVDIVTEEIRTRRHVR